MKLFQLQHHPSPFVVRTFGLFFLVFSLFLGAIAGYRFQRWDLAKVVTGTGTGLCLMHAIVPSWRRPMVMGWAYLTAPLGWFVLHLVVVVAYFGVVTPLGILLRVLGRDPLERRFDRARSSYFVTRRDARGLADYFRQY